MRYALIRYEDNVVESVIILDEDSVWPIPDGYYLIASEIANCRDTYINEVFIRPDPIEDPIDKDALLAEIQKLIDQLTNS